MNKQQNLGRVLSKTEQKKIMGGVVDGGGASCYTTECTLTIQWGTPLAPGWTTYHGNCATSSTGCYCNTAYYDTQAPVTSNGGVSRCTVQ